MANKVIPKKTSKVMACLNTPIYEVKQLMEGKGYKFILVNTTKFTLPSQSKTVFGFTSLTYMMPHLKNLLRPPILWDSVVTVRHLHLNQPVLFLDANVMTDGLVLFKEIDQSALFLMANRMFLFRSDIKFEKDKTIKLGDGSKLSVALNNFLATLPDYVWEPTIIALVSSMERFDFSVFDSFVSSNRLLTNENKLEYVFLAECLTGIKEGIEILSRGDRKEMNRWLAKNKDKKGSIARVRYLFSYYGTKAVDKYIDDEDNVNAVCETI